jgi:phenylacetic acid degradation operon negative regulatory protein
MIKFSISEYILLGLSLVAQGLDETIGAGHRAYRFGKLGFYNPPGYKNDYFESTLRRLIKKKYLSGEIKSDLHLTEQGWQRINKDFPFIDWQKEKWDGNWRMVIFDVAVKDNSIRQKLRRELLKLKFGQFQESIYITPHHVDEIIWQWLKENKLDNQAGVLVAKQLFVGNFKVLAQKIWRLDRLNIFYKRLERIKAKDELTARRWLKQYLEIVAEDPFLPQELLPETWFGFEAKKTWKQMVKKYGI